GGERARGRAGGWRGWGGGAGVVEGGGGGGLARRSIYRALRIAWVSTRSALHQALFPAVRAQERRSPGRVRDSASDRWFQGLWPRWSQNCTSRPDCHRPQKVPVGSPRLRSRCQVIAQISADR